MVKTENSEAPKDSAPVRYSMQPLISKMTIIPMMPMMTMTMMRRMMTMMTMMTTHPK